MKRYTIKVSTPLLLSIFATFVVLLAATIFTPVKAADLSYADSEVSIAFGYDIIHTRDDDGRIKRAQGAEDPLTREYGEIRYRSELYEFDTVNAKSAIGFNGYVGTKETLGVGLYYTYGRFLTSFGVEKAEPNFLTSTEGAYEILFEWKYRDNLSIGLKHRSNCKSVCPKLGIDGILPHGGAEDTNRGWNYLTLRYHFDG